MQESVDEAATASLFQKLFSRETVYRIQRILERRKTLKKRWTVLSFPFLAKVLKRTFWEFLWTNGRARKRCQEKSWQDFLRILCSLFLFLFSVLDAVLLIPLISGELSVCVMLRCKEKLCKIVWFLHSCCRQSTGYAFANDVHFVGLSSYSYCSFCFLLRETTETLRKQITLPIPFSHVETFCILVDKCVVAEALIETV